MNSDDPDFQIELDQYRGPADLLLWLVRRNELDVRELPLQRLVQQYLDYLEVLREIDIDLVGEFLEITSMLIEAKMRSILPSADDEPDTGESDPREDLVHRLLLYKDFKDVSILLEDRSRQWQNRYPRLATDIPPREIDPREQPVHEVELWDLVSSFGRVLRNSVPPPETSIILDETPIQVYMQRIHDRLARTGCLKFSDLFEPGMHKSALVGIFLAILELVRHHDIRTEQVGEHGEIEILPGENFDSTADFGDVTEY